MQFDPETYTGRSVKVNVGGVIYSTTCTTLAKYPNSMLGLMFTCNEYFECEPEESTGARFIDRNGELFHYVLEFLRNDTLHLGDDEMLLQRLKDEADFYQIQPLIDYLDNLSTKPSRPRHRFLIRLEECYPTGSNVKQWTWRIFRPPEFVYWESESERKVLESIPTYQALINPPFEKEKDDIILRLAAMKAQPFENSPLCRDRYRYGGSGEYFVDL